ncbi:hypothetical protein AB0284_21595 [Pseudarthrobacter phenanthrenivorans]|uniref:phage holin n=1 Tax=Pseudarthrobacter phenanthrenivorans TaxID=361575 RepID=UPI00344DA5BC
MADHRAPTDRTPNRWIPDPIIRKYLYGVVLAMIPVLVAFGFISPEQVQLWLNLAAAVLGLGTTVLATANTPK